MTTQDGTTLGRRIRQLRMARNLSLDALSVELGGIVTRQALSKYENSQSRPSPVVLTKLAGALGVRSAYLFREPTIRVEFMAYRKSSVLSKREQERVEAIVEQALEDRVRLQELTDQQDGSLIPVKQFVVNNLEDAELAAETMRKNWQLGLGPVSNACVTMENHSLAVLTLEADEKFDGISAIAYDDNDCVKAAAIVSRRDVDGERQRLNLAHELGHVVLDVAEDVNEETAAFRFGAAFLAPRERIIEEAGTKRAHIEIEELMLLKEQFGISMQALIRRFLDLGIISESYYSQWWPLFTRLGWRKTEPGQLPFEEPHWLRRTTLRLLAEGVISPDDAERLMGKNNELGLPIASVRGREFLKLPMETRRQILEAEANKVAAYYGQDTDWRELLEDDLIDY
jgi:Zn-dependent peptidase ImmA (M78 family)